MNIPNMLFLLALIPLILFHNNSYGMRSLLTEGAKNYRTLKDASLKHPTVNKEKIGENIFLQTITPQTSFLESDIFNFALHCPEGLLHDQEEQRKLTLESKIRIFFSNSPLLGEVDKLLDCIDDEGNTHKMNEHDLQLFFNDAFNPSIYTNLIPKELVAKDRNAIKSFMMSLNILKKEKKNNYSSTAYQKYFYSRSLF